MIENEEPGVPAAEVGAVEEAGRAQVRAETWTLPEPNALRLCPKCGPVNPDDDSNQVTGIFQIKYHYAQQSFDHSLSAEAQLSINPCALLDPRVFPAQMPNGMGGEHLCVICTRCHFGWAERVRQEGPVYWRRYEGDGEGD